MSIVYIAGNVPVENKRVTFILYIWDLSFRHRPGLFFPPTPDEFGCLKSQYCATGLYICIYARNYTEKRRYTEKRSLRMQR